jgi:sigma-E factor negative regulatory protein RseB
MNNLLCKFMKSVVFVFAVLPFVAHSSTLPILDGDYWIKGMISSYAKSNYELLFAKASVGAIEPIMLSHGVVNGEAYSHWLYLNGVPTGYFTKGENIVYFVAGQEPYVVKNSNLPSVFTRLQTIDPDVLLKQYEAVVTGKQRVANRGSISVRLSSIKNDRYNYELIIDEKTGLLLQVTVLSTKDEVVESFACMSLIELDAPNQLIEDVSRMNLSFPVVADRNEMLDGSELKLGYLPTGFHEVFSKKYNLTDSNMPIEHKIFSDGLVDFSVYKIDSVGSMDFPIVKQGGTNLFRHIIGNKEIIVVGDLPLDTEKNIAEGFIE